MRNRHGRELAHTALATIALMLILSFASLSLAADENELGAEWESALAPLSSLPVQSNGFVRSGETFARYRLEAISGKTKYAGHSAVETVIWLMADDEARATAPLMRTGHPEIAKAFEAKRISLRDYADPEKIKLVNAAFTADQEGLQRPIEELDYRAYQLDSLEKDLAIVPRDGEWLSPVDIHNHSADAGPFDAAIHRDWHALKDAIVADDAVAGEEAATALVASVHAAAEARDIALPRLALDLFYTRAAPFKVSAVFYLFAALCYGGCLLFGWRRLAIAGYVLLAMGLCEEILGVTCRWMLSGRAPLSNMYESFVFATAGMIAVALWFEATNRTRLAGFGGSALGFIFMILAHNAPIFDSEIRPLMPALQSSWLTYHVIIIMLSYSAFAVSFFVAVTYLGKDILGGDSSKIGVVRSLPELAALDIFNYKIIAVGFPLLTVGIILGAVWANTAWSRPWGFDPKETWSAITWLIYAIYFHLRLIGGWKGRRAAIVSLIGFACVLFTYLGVNYLLPSLHSYVN